MREGFKIRQRMEEGTKMRQRMEGGLKNAPKPVVAKHALPFVWFHEDPIVSAAYCTVQRDIEEKTRPEPEFQNFKEPKNRFKEPIPPSCGAYRAGTTTLFLVGS